MKDINGNPVDFGSAATSSSPQKEASESKAATAKGDYIDFEEIK